MRSSLPASPRVKYSWTWTPLNWAQYSGRDSIRDYSRRAHHHRDLVAARVRAEGGETPAAAPSSAARRVRRASARRPGRDAVGLTGRGRCTRASLVPAIVARADRDHADDVPCVIALPVAAGHPAYLKWIFQETAPTLVAINSCSLFQASSSRWSRCG